MRSARRWIPTAIRLGVLFGMAARPAAAQVVGTVTDEAGAPVAGVAVELWSAAGRVAAVTSDGAGRFALPEETRGAGRIVLRRLGYEPLAAAFAPDAPHAYRMRPAAVALAGVSGAATREPCPRRDEPAAREIWRAAAARYTHDTPAYEYSVSRIEHHGWVLPADRAFPDERRLESGSEGRAATRPIESYIARSGYAFRRRPGEMGYWWPEDYDRWNYVELDTRHAYHFATDEFGRLNVLAVVRRDVDGTTLAFCSRAVRPSIDGTLTVGTDGSFVSAGWRFRTPGPDEEAGGKVVFAPPGPGEAPHLLAARGLFWRRGAMPGRYWQRATINLSWVIDHEPQPMQPASR